ncbi:MAG: long-chain fatty acid--CoA ligase [Cyclobacteriaceae bacterium]
MSGYNVNTLPGLFLTHSEKFGNNIALRHKSLGLWQDVTWNQYREAAMSVATGLLSIGADKGDFVGVIGENCPEWLYIDLGAQLAGAVTVGIYTTNAVEQCEYVVNHAQCTYLFLENEEQLDKWLQFRDTSPQIKKVIVWDWKGLDNFSDDLVISLDELMEIGEKADGEIVAKGENIRKGLEEDETSILIYTSGTTGPPKGVMLTHKNLTWAAHALSNIQEETRVRPGDEVLSFLPLCHIFERMFSVVLHIQAGYVVNFIERPETIAENLREISPTIGYAVPRIWEKYHAKINLAIDEATIVKRWFAQYAIRHGKRLIQRKIDHKGISFFAKATRWVLKRTVYWQIRKHLGMERMRYAFSGAAPIAPDILLFFNAIGLNILEGYGQSETCAVTSATRYGAFRFGTVGLPLPGVEVRLSDEGEILVKGPCVFKGYFKNEEATRNTIKEGWLYTGDIGEIDETDHIIITDRKKDIIITAGGKNIAPQYIENKLKCSSYVNDAVVIGDKRKFVSALIVLDEENINKYAQDHKVVYQTYADLAVDDQIIQLLQKEIDSVNKELSRVESVRKFVILPKRLYEEDGDVTPTMKVKRSAISKNYEQLIESMYQ